MRILLVSWAFPPYNCSGAVRVGKTAKYLHRLGHDVRVLTARGLGFPPTLDVEIPDDRITATRWVDNSRVVQATLGGRERVGERGYTLPGRMSGTVRRASLIYRTLVHLPDRQIGWMPFALAAGRRLLRTWQPDVVYASAHPVTGFLVGRRLAAIAGVPWVAEYRDLWLEEPSYPFEGLRRRLDAWLERRILASAAGLVTVSEPLAETLRHKTSVPVEVVLNGYDPTDAARGARSAEGEGIELSYTGMLYEGRQDPGPLFQALQLLGADRSRVRLRFYGRYLGAVERAAAEAGVADLVEIRPPVSHREALEIQARSDALMLFPFLGEADRGAYGAKFFEYAGAGRPILGVGPLLGVASEAIVTHRLGVVSDDPPVIARQLQHWIGEKRDGGIAPVNAAITAQFTREEQTRRLELFLQRIHASAG